MALIKCEECGKEISDKADKCPNCGFPIKEMKNDLKKDEIEKTKEKTSKSNILAGIMLILFIPLGSIGIAISFLGIIWALVELCDKDIKKKGWIVAGMIVYFIIFVLGCLVVTNTYHSNTSGSASTGITDPLLTDSKITQENYEKIVEGMTEEEVNSILGTPTSNSESQIPDLGTMKINNYQDTLSNKVITIVFSNGRVNSKNWTEL